MTPEQINIAICAHLHGAPVMNSICGECFGTGRTGSEGDCYPCDHCHQTGAAAPRYTGPNYSGDLNACHEMEKAMDRSQCFAYHDILRGLLPARADMKTNSELWTFHAPAHERAEAFCRAAKIGEWKEAP